MAGRLTLPALVAPLLAIAALAAGGPDLLSGAPAPVAQAAAIPGATPHHERAGLAKARRARLSGSRGVEFGIYPGGGAGAVNGRGEPRPEVPTLRASAVVKLRGDDARPFVVHLYDAYTQPRDADAVPAWLQSQIDEATSRGIRVELVLRYRPSRGADVAGFTRFVERRVAQLGPDRNVTSLQITNEANVPGAPDAADGAYRGAKQALVRGVIAAKSAVRRLGHEQLAIGFNWANEDVARARPFFRSLRTLGGRRFARSVDWVGVDAYPGTWGPALPRGDFDRAVRRATQATIDALRGRLLPAAGLPKAPIVFAESGYPTDFGRRTEAAQVTVLRATVETVIKLRRSRGVVGYRWFDLRDADSAVPSFESQYGLMRDDYTPKAGFTVYQQLIARHG